MFLQQPWPKSAYPKEEGPWTMRYFPVPNLLAHCPDAIARPSCHRHLQHQPPCWAPGCPGGLRGGREARPGSPPASGRSSPAASPRLPGTPAAPEGAAAAPGAAGPGTLPATLRAAGSTAPPGANLRRPPHGRQRGGAGRGGGPCRPAIGCSPRRPRCDRCAPQSVPPGPAPPRLYNGHPHGRGG